MNLPAGLLFYLDNQVEVGRTSGAHASGGGTYQSVYDAHYNNSGYQHSFGTGESTNGVVLATTGGTEITLTYSGGEASLASLRVYVSSAATVIDTADSATTAFALSPQNWTDDLFKSNQIKVTIPLNTSTDAPGGGDVVIAGAIAQWDVYADLEANANMAEVRLIVTSVTVQAESRKMRAHWTPELAQDLAAYHSIDAEAELTALLSEELAAEIDREIIRDLITVAPFQTSWSYDRSVAITDVLGRTINADPASGYVTQKEWNQTLLTQINKVSSEIHKRTLRGGANWLICSTEVSSVIDDIEKFHAANDADVMQYNMGIEHMGQLGNRYTVYKDPYLPSHVCLIGHKGTNMLDTGYVYAPYIPFQLTPVVLHHDDFTPRKGIMTRYARKVVNNKYYGMINVVFPTSYAIVNYME